jgi:hypothetical protein
MKKILLLGFFLLVQTVNSQQILISTTHHNILYLGSVNYVGIMIEGTNCKELKIEIDNGTIVGKNCEYTIIPKELGDLKISVYNKKNKLIGQKTLKVLDLCPNAHLNTPVDKQGKKIIQKAISLSIEVRDLNLNFNTPKIEYKLIVIRDDTVIFNKTFFERVFSDELKQMMEGLKTNDILIFTNIKSKYNEKQFLVDDLLLKI